MMASAHASRVEARKAATSKGMGASHAAHHQGSRPVAKYCNTPDSNAAPKRQPRLSRRKARGRGINGSRPYNVPDQPPLPAVGCIGRLADWLVVGGMRGDTEPHQPTWGAYRRRTSYRPLHGGVGNLGLPAATSSGQTTTCLPSCHWMVIALWPIWNPRSSTAKSPKTVLAFVLSNSSRSLPESRLPPRRTASTKSSQPA